MMFSTAKVNDWYMTSGKGLAKVAIIYKDTTGVIDSVDCILGNELRIYTVDGTISSLNEGYDKFKIIYPMSIQDYPELYL